MKRLTETWQQQKKSGTYGQNMGDGKEGLSHSLTSSVRNVGRKRLGRLPVSGISHKSKVSVNEKSDQHGKQAAVTVESTSGSSRRQSETDLSFSSSFGVDLDNDLMSVLDKLENDYEKETSCTIKQLNTPSRPTTRQSLRVQFTESKVLNSGKRSCQIQHKPNQNPDISSHITLHQSDTATVPTKSHKAKPTVSRKPALNLNSLTGSKTYRSLNTFTNLDVNSTGNHKNFAEQKENQAVSSPRHSQSKARRRGSTESSSLHDISWSSPQGKSTPQHSPIHKSKSKPKEQGSKQRSGQELSKKSLPLNQQGSAVTLRVPATGANGQTGNGSENGRRISPRQKHKGQGSINKSNFFDSMFEDLNNSDDTKSMDDSNDYNANKETKKDAVSSKLHTSLINANATNAVSDNRKTKKNIVVIDSPDEKVKCYEVNDDNPVTVDVRENSLIIADNNSTEKDVSSGLHSGTTSGRPCLIQTSGKDIGEEQLLLSAWGLPDPVLKQYHSRNVKQMFPWQAECLLVGNVLQGGNLVYSAPTSAGKTMVAELLVLKRVMETRKKAIIILPFVSVTREKMFYLQELYQDAGIRVSGFMGHYSPAGGFSNVDVAVCTIEKGNSLINRLLEEKKLDQLGVVVVDELHLIGDPHRGYLLELLLTKICYMGRKSRQKAVSKEGHNPSNQVQIIGMSATLPNLDLLAHWLKADLYRTDFRPVPLTECVKIGTAIYDNTMKQIRNIDTSYSVKGDDDHIVPICIETIREGHSILIFCPYKNWCEKQCETIAREFYKLLRDPSIATVDKGFRKASDVLVLPLDQVKLRDVVEQLKRTPVGLDSVLGRTVPYGVAYHHAGLTFDERDIVEGAFRQGVVKVLVATSTLSSGVNLPARRVVIRTPMFHGQLIDFLTYKQMIGRAGRKGVDTQGESILVCKPTERAKATTLVTGSLPPVSSTLIKHQGESLSSSLKRAILEVVVSGVAMAPADVAAYTSCTLLAASLPTDSDQTRDLIKACTSFLQENEFVCCQKILSEGTQTDRFVPTQLGSAVLASSLSPDEGLVVFSELQKARQCFVLENELHIIYLVTPIYSIGIGESIDWFQFLCLWESLSAGMKRVAELVGVKESFLAKAVTGRLPCSTKAQLKAAAIHKRFYTALVLHDLVHEMSLSEVVKKYNCNKGQLQSLQQSAATFAGMVTVFCARLGWSNLELILGQFQSRLTFGVQRELCDLVRMSTLNGQRARVLYNSGYQTVAALASAEVLDIEAVLKNSAPFQSNKKQETESDWEAERRRQTRCIWLTGRKGVTEHEAAIIIIEEAKSMIEEELGGLGIQWRTTSADTNRQQQQTSADSNRQQQQTSADTNRQQQQTSADSNRQQQQTSADTNRQQQQMTKTESVHSPALTSPASDINTSARNRGRRQIHRVGARKSPQSSKVSPCHSGPALTSPLVSQMSRPLTCVRSPQEKAPVMCVVSPPGLTIQSVSSPAPVSSGHKTSCSTEQPDSAQTSSIVDERCPGKPRHPLVEDNEHRTKKSLLNKRDIIEKTVETKSVSVLYTNQDTSNDEMRKEDKTTSSESGILHLRKSESKPLHESLINASEKGHSSNSSKEHSILNKKDNITSVSLNKTVQKPVRETNNTEIKSSTSAGCFNTVQMKTFQDNTVPPVLRTVEQKQPSVTDDRSLLFPGSSDWAKSSFSCVIQKCGETSKDETKHDSEVQQSRLEKDSSLEAEKSSLKHFLGTSNQSDNSYIRQTQKVNVTKTVTFADDNNITGSVRNNITGSVRNNITGSVRNNHKVNLSSCDNESKRPSPLQNNIFYQETITHKAVTFQSDLKSGKNHPSDDNMDIQLYIAGQSDDSFGEEFSDSFVYDTQTVGMLSDSKNLGKQHNFEAQYSTSKCQGHDGIEGEGQTNSVTGLMLRQDDTGNRSDTVKCDAQEKVDLCRISMEVEENSDQHVIEKQNVIHVQHSESLFSPDSNTSVVNQHDSISVRNTPDLENIQGNQSASLLGSEEEVDLLEINLYDNSGDNSMDLIAASNYERVGYGDSSDLDEDQSSVINDTFNELRIQTKIQGADKFGGNERSKQLGVRQSGRLGNFTSPPPSIQYTGLQEDLAIAEEMGDSFTCSFMGVVEDKNKNISSDICSKSKKKETLCSVNVDLPSGNGNVLKNSSGAERNIEKLWDSMSLSMMDHVTTPEEKMNEITVETKEKERCKDEMRFTKLHHKDVLVHEKHPDEGKSKEEGNCRMRNMASESRTASPCCETELASLSVIDAMCCSFDSSKSDPVSVIQKSTASMVKPSLLLGLESNVKNDGKISSNFNSSSQMRKKRKSVENAALNDCGTLDINVKQKRIGDNSHNSFPGPRSNEHFQMIPGGLNCLQNQEGDQNSPKNTNSDCLPPTPPGEITCPSPIVGSKQTPRPSSVVGRLQMSMFSPCIEKTMTGLKTNLKEKKSDESIPRSYFSNKNSSSDIKEIGMKKFEKNQGSSEKINKKMNFGNLELGNTTSGCMEKSEECSPCEIKRSVKVRNKFNLVNNEEDSTAVDTIVVSSNHPQVVDEEDKDDDNSNDNEDEDKLSPSFLDPDDIVSLATQTSFAIIDVCADKRLFKTFIMEWRTKTRYAISLACERKPRQPARPGTGIGANFTTTGNNLPQTDSADTTSMDGIDLMEGGLMLVGLAICWENRDTYYVSLTQGETSQDSNDLDSSLSAPPTDPDISLSIRQKAVKSVLKQHVTDQNQVTIIMFDMKAQYRALVKGCGLVPKGQLQDPKIACWLLDPGAREKNLHRMVTNLLPSEVHLLEGIGGGIGVGSLGMSPQNPGSGRYRATTECVLTYHLMGYFQTCLEKDELYQVFTDIEMPVAVTLCRMELNGFGFSQEESETQKNIMLAKLSALEEQAYSLAGHVFSLSATDDAAQVLFIELQLPPNGDPILGPGGRAQPHKRQIGGRRGRQKCNLSTSKDVLEKLKKFHPLPGIILEWRRITNALTKVVFPLQKEKIYCERVAMYRMFCNVQLHSATGRVSLTEPNLQNIPKDFEITLPDMIGESPPPNALGSLSERTSRRKSCLNQMRGPHQVAMVTENASKSLFAVSMRHAFVPFEGGVMLAADYSQLELRIIAYLSGDVKLLKILNMDGDVFKLIAGQWKCVTVEEVTAEQRAQAKQVCYGMIYGIGPKALGEQLGVDENDAGVFIETFKAKYPGMRSYLRKTVELCREKKYVQTMTGRKRYLEAITGSNPFARAQAERQAVNTTVQGSAADLVKKAMIQIDQRLTTAFPECLYTHTHTHRQDIKKRVHTDSSCPPRGAYLVLQLHDELIYEVNKRDVTMVASIVKEEMEKSADLPVRLPVKVSVGPTWGKLEQFNI